MSEPPTDRRAVVAAPLSLSPGDAGAPLIGVIVVNSNGWRSTVAAHRSLLQSTCTRWLLIVVDDASTDDSTLRLTEQLPHAVLIRNRANSGLAGSCNLGLREAQARGLRHAFLLANDAEVLPDTLGALLAASAALQDRAVLGSVVRHWPSGSLRFFGSRTHPLHGGPDWFREPAHSGLLQQDLIDSDFLIGAALFMPLQIVRDVGEFDERFFLTYEETDWCYRARARGWRALVVAASVVRYAGRAPTGGHEAPRESYFLHRNRLLFSEKHAAPDQRLRVLHATWRSFRADLRKLHAAARAAGLRMDPGKKAVLLAVRDYVLRRFGDCPPDVRRLSSPARGRQLEPAQSKA